MRGSFNVGLRDGEWWTQGEQDLRSCTHRRRATGGGVRRQPRAVGDRELLGAARRNKLRFSALYTPAMTEASRSRTGRDRDHDLASPSRNSCRGRDLGRGSLRGLRGHGGGWCGTVHGDAVRSPLRRGTAPRRELPVHRPLARNTAGNGDQHDRRGSVGSCVVFEQPSHTAASIPRGAQRRQQETCT